MEGHQREVEPVIFSPNGEMAASGGFDGTVRLWRVSTGGPMGILQASGATRSLSFSRDGKWIAAVVTDRRVHLWDVRERKEFLVLDDYTPQVGAVAYSPDGKLLAFVSNPNRAFVWDAYTFEPVYSLEGLNANPRSLAFSPNGKLLAATSDQAAVPVWEIPPGWEYATWADHADVVSEVAFSPDGTLAATASRDRTVRLWKVESGEVVSVLNGHTDMIFAVAFSPNGTLLASAGRDRTIRLWEMPSGQPLHVLEGHGHDIWDVAFSPDGTLLVSGGEDTALRLWDPSSGQPLGTLGTTSSAIYAVAFSPNGRVVASGENHAVVRLWSVRDRKLLATLAGHTGGVNSLSFHPDRVHLASGSADGSVLIWDVSEYLAEPEPPVVQLLEPRDGAVVDRETVSLRALIRSQDAPVQQVRVLVNGETVLEDGSGRLLAGENGETLETVVLLSPGQNEIAVTATNRHGESASAIATVTYRPPPPVVQLLEPPGDVMTDRSPFPLRVAVTGSERFPLRRIEVTVNGRPVPLPPEAIASGQLEVALPLEPGPNRVRVVAANDHGESPPVEAAITYEPPPPIVRLIEPSGDIAVGRGTLRLRAEVIPPDGAPTRRVQITVASESRTMTIEPELLSNQIETTVLLEPGANRITIVAINDYGQSKPVAITVTYQLQLPTVQILEPRPNTTTDRSPILLRAAVVSLGSAPIRDVRITVNGRPVAVGGDGARTLTIEPDQIEQQIPLSPGRNEIAVVAVNDFGESAPATVTVIYRPPVPTVRILEPQPGTVANRATVPLRAEVISSPGTPIRWVQVSVNGRPILMGESQAFALSSGPLEQTVPLSPGENEIVVIAANDYGESSPATTVVIYQPPAPTVQILEPRSGTTTDRDSVLLRALAVSPGGSPIRNVRVTVNGRPVPGDPDGATSVSGSGRIERTVPLRPGRNEIVLIVADDYGESEPAAVIVTYQPSTPVVQILEPQSGAMVQQNPLRLRALVLNPTGAPIRRVRVTVNGRPLQGDSALRTLTVEPSGAPNSIEMSIPLEPGENQISLVVVGETGESSPATVVVTYQESALHVPTFALLVGTSAYDHLPDLVNPVPDVLAVERELREVYRVQTQTLLNPTQEEFLEALYGLARREWGEDDQLLVFISGHGAFNETLKRGYLAFRDTRTPLEDSLWRTFVSHEDVRTVLERLDCPHVLLVVDSCFSGTIDPTIAMASNRQAGQIYVQIPPREYIQRKLRYRTRRYLTAGGKEYVPDGRPGHHSPFTAAFLEALRSFGGPDGILTLEEIQLYLEKVRPEPRAGSFTGDEPGSSFVLVAHLE